MSPRWIMGLVILVLGMGFLGGVIEGTYMTGDVPTTLETLLSPDMVGSDIPVIGSVITFVSMAWEYASALWSMFWFDYPFFEGPWVVVRFAFLAISVALIFSILLAIRGTSS